MSPCTLSPHPSTRCPRARRACKTPHLLHSTTCACACVRGGSGGGCDGRADDAWYSSTSVHPELPRPAAGRSCFRRGSCCRAAWSRRHPLSLSLSVPVSSPSLSPCFKVLTLYKHTHLDIFYRNFKVLFMRNVSFVKVLPRKTGPVRTAHSTARRVESESSRHRSTTQHRQPRARTTRGVSRPRRRHRPLLVATVRRKHTVLDAVLAALRLTRVASTPVAHPTPPRLACHPSCSLSPVTSEQPPRSACSSAHPLTRPSRGSDVDCRTVALVIVLMCVRSELRAAHA